MKLLSVLALGLGLAAFAAPALAAPIGFGGADLGMSLSDWRLATPPQGLEPAAHPVCSTDPQIAQAGAGALQAADTRGGDVVCAYAAIYGHDVLTQSLPLSGRYRARSLRYLFRRGRLHEIAFATSVDAYDNVVAQLDAQLGQPIHMRRDRIHTSMGKLFRVTDTWSAPGVEAVLVDPSAQLTQLSVRFIATPTTQGHADASHDGPSAG